MLPASKQSTVAATFDDPNDSQLAVWDLRSAGFPQDHIHLRGESQATVIVEAGDRYPEAEHVLRRYDLRRLRIWMRSNHPERPGATVAPPHTAAVSPPGWSQPA